MTKRLLLVGGTGGLGKQVYDILKDKYHVDSFGSDMSIQEPLKMGLDYDIVINLATINIDGLFTNLMDSDIEKMIQVNVIGHSHVCAACIPYMKLKGYGRIIYISSILGDNPIKGTSIYAAGKKFCETLTRTIGLENAKYGITANSIALGYFNGGLTNKVPEKILEKVLSTNPLKRLGNVEEICNAIEFIVNTEYFNASTLKLDGGQC
jgi:NAD(P)-dependent dehydrogenase (short-subunit alcohol dehydrogenase family)